MCKQKDAPDPVINTCKGRNCGDTFTGPNRPNKRSVSTEYLETPHLKGQQKILHSLFISKNGTLANYYMYYSVTNFGRTTSSFATTCYYDEAPLDEYGLPRETKWGHLRDLHAALRLSKKALLWGVTSAQKLGEDLEVKCIMPAGPNLRKAR
uniref:beta-galactosidase n=1 Tax=Vitis vinifera TaxID=29760 RepID=F6GWK3_VITVI